jgi:hypothetical protein
LKREGETEGGEFLCPNERSGKGLLLKDDSTPPTKTLFGSND